MKTRIKIIHVYEGHTEYYPEFKRWFFWYGLSRYDYSGSCPYYLTLEQAQEVIDKFLAKPPVKYVEYPRDQS